MRRLYCTLVSALLVVSASVSRAQPSEVAAKPTAATSCPASCAAPRSALDAVAAGVVAGLSRAPAGALVISAPLVSDAKAVTGDKLASKLAELVAGRLGGDVRHHPAPLSLEEARLRAAKTPGFLYLRPVIEAGRLRLGADAFSVPHSVWGRARASQRGPVAHAFAQAALDAEVRSFLEPIPFVDPSVTKFEGADPDILALACGDLDGDGGSDLVTLTRQRLLQVRLHDGKVERMREAAWDGLAPIAPVPLRQPLAFATIVEGVHGGAAGYLDAAISDRAGSVRLTPELTLQTRMQGKALPHGRITGCTWIAHLALGKTLLPCGEGADAEPLAELGRQSDAIDSMFLVARDGHGRVVHALRHDSALVLKGLGDDKVIGRVGAQLAVADLDQDGAPELATTIDVLSPKHDALEVRTLLSSGTVKRRYRVAVPSGVEALTACPPDSSGRAPLVLATRGELWVVR